MSKLDSILENYNLIGRGDQFNVLIITELGRTSFLGTRKAGTSYHNFHTQDGDSWLSHLCTQWTVSCKR